MAEIVHKLPVHAPIDDVWSALETAGLPSTSRDGVVELRFGVTLTARMRLVDREDGTSAASPQRGPHQRAMRLAWRCVDGPADWIDTDVVIDLAPDGDDTIVRLRHANWREVNDFMGHCSTRWAWLLFGLKSRVEIPEAEDLWA